MNLSLLKVGTENEIENEDENENENEINRRNETKNGRLESTARAYVMQTEFRQEVSLAYLPLARLLQLRGHSHRSRQRAVEDVWAFQLVY